MTLAWSTTEIIRYAFYACSLLNYEPYFLLWLRYTTFYVLYPLGAGSEAFLAFFTLPFGKHFIPQFRSMYHGLWTYSEYARAALFVIWWPGESCTTSVDIYLALTLSRSVYYVHTYDGTEAKGVPQANQNQNAIVVQQ